MYNEHLEKLIDLAIIDGHLTEKERQVLLVKAREQGIDTDEFELVLEARLYQKRQAMNGANPPSREDRLNLHKCPNCGEIPTGISKICPSCGFIFSKESDQTELDKSIRTLEELLLELRNFPRLSYLTTGKCIVLAAGILFICFFLKGSKAKASSVAILFGVGAYYLFKKQGVEELLSVVQSNQFEYILERITSQTRSIQNAYGESTQVRHLLDKLDTERATIIKERKKSRTLAIGLIVTILALAIIGILLAATNGPDNIQDIINQNL